MRSVALVIVTVLAAASPVLADLLPPDSKWVTHVVRFENLADHTDYVFYVYPRDLNRGQAGNSSIRVPESGEVTISGINPLATAGGIFLFAIPRKIHGPDGAGPKEEWFDGKTPGVLKSNPLVHPTRALSKSDHRDRIVTTYRIDLNDVLKLEEVASAKAGDETSQSENVVSMTTEPSGFGLWRIVAACAAAGMALGLGVWLAVRKKV